MHFNLDLAVNSFPLLLIGAGVTWGMCYAYGWPPTLHWWVIAAGLGATLLIGAVAGLYPAIRAARTPPTAALASQ